MLLKHWDVQLDAELTGLKLTAFGAADNAVPLSKEDERSAALARRAQQGDYDDGANSQKIYLNWKAS